MLDPQMAAAFGQQSSQPMGKWAEPQKAEGNENLAYYLAMLASNPGAQNPFGVTSGAQETGSLTGYNMPSMTYQTQPSTFENFLSGTQTGLQALKTGTDLYKAGSNLYGALFGGAAASPSLGDPSTWSWMGDTAAPGYWEALSDSIWGI